MPANVIIEVCIWSWLGSNKRLSFAFRISCSCMYAHTVYIILTKRCLQFSFSHSLTHTLNDTHPISLFKPVPHVHICSVFKPVPPAIWAQLEAPLPMQASGKGPSLLSSSLISVASVLWQPLTLALRNYCCLKEQDGMGNEREGGGGETGSWKKTVEGEKWGEEEVDRNGQDQQRKGIEIEEADEKRSKRGRREGRKRQRGNEQTAGRLPPVVFVFTCCVFLCVRMCVFDWVTERVRELRAWVWVRW